MGTIVRKIGDMLAGGTSKRQRLEVDMESVLQLRSGLINEALRKNERSPQTSDIAEICYV
jgi:hypothetical protein